MGITLADAKLLLKTRAEGAAFGRTLTLGQQKLFFEPTRLEPTARRFGITDTDFTRFLADARDQGPADALFRLLGAGEVQALDFSDYEGAQIIADLNEPVPANLHQAFDAVFDGGTLEHVFHFPTALRNAMAMTRVGGTLILSTTANNLCGHGFYQFSPELLFNVLNEENGFARPRVFAFEVSPEQAIYEVADPARVHARVEIRNRWPTLLFVVAKRVADRPLLTKAPLQSDYQPLWQGADAEAPARARGPRLPEWTRGLRSRVQAWHLRDSWCQPEHFRRIEL
jgi:hypothetical protein